MSHVMSYTKDLSGFLGAFLISGIEGTVLDAETAAWIQRSHVGGILLFKKNYQHPAQVQQLIQALQAARAPGEPPLLICVDQEGGRVQRFQEGLTLFPSAEALSKQPPEITFQVTLALASELKALGIGLNFSPVSDILSEPHNPVMQGRCFGSTPEAVIPHLQAVIQAHQKAGVLSCMKHFPGHGDTLIDSHLELPKMTQALSQLRTREFLPFRAGKELGCPSLMMGHLLHPEVDPLLPASLSTHWIQGILREELGYQGIVISDDLEMEAITRHYSAKEAPLKALEAGCDLVIYRSCSAAKAALVNLEEGFQAGRLSFASLQASFERLSRIRESLS